ncbi:MAG: slipin family protein [Dehalococcoidia bacterium]|nr:slipin family protein [Dehalococcoidia bacterium]MDP6511146.1 slipin family protein [Dehalococcoidia bacterium]MDP6782038.1 slipin family protein [Dehalococcoidia bacterium]
MSQLIPFGIIAVLLLVVVPAAVRIVWQYESGVHFRLGRLVGIKPPGVRFMIPFIDTIRKIDTRVVTLDVPAQEAITKDNVTLRVNAVVYFRVVHADQAVVNVADYRIATFQIAQTTLRSVLGKSSLDELLAEREKLNDSLREIIDEATEPWGIKVSMVEVKDVELPDTMQRAMAAQAEAERERRAKIIHAEGEFEASQRLADAARVIGSQPATLQLRYLQTLTTIATERTNTVVFPLPLDILEAFTRNMKGTKSGD